MKEFHFISFDRFKVTQKKECGKYGKSGKNKKRKETTLQLC